MYSFTYSAPIMVMDRCSIWSPAAYISVSWLASLVVVTCYEVPTFGHICSVDRGRFRESIGTHEFMDLYICVSVTESFITHATSVIALFGGVFTLLSSVCSWS